MRSICKCVLPAAILVGALVQPQMAASQSFEMFEHSASVPESAQNEVHDRQPLPAAYPRKPANTSYREALYLSAVAQAEERYRIPRNLLRALIWQESRFNPMAVSPAGAAGLAQLMPATARYLGVENRHDPLASIDGGARYLKEMLDRFEAVHLALAAYNAGPGAVARRGTIPRNGETPAYVNAVLKRWNTVGS